MTVTGDATFDTSTLHVDSTNDRVGIGTTSPSVPLHLNIGTNNNGILVESTDATARMSFKDSSSSGTTYVGIGAVGDDMSLWAGNSKKITVKSDGKVGIGTTSPDTNLEVVGSVRASTSFLVNSSGDDGIGHVTGSYGSVQTRGTGAGSWEGYSINGQQVFMGNGTETCGIYNDVDNQWLLYFDADTHTRLYDLGRDRGVRCEQRHHNWRRRKRQWLHRHLQRVRRSNRNHRQALYDDGRWSHDETPWL